MARPHPILHSQRRSHWWFPHIINLLEYVAWLINYITTSHHWMCHTPNPCNPHPTILLEADNTTTEVWFENPVNHPSLIEPYNAYNVPSWSTTLLTSLQCTNPHITMWLLIIFLISPLSLISLTHYPLSCKNTHNSLLVRTSFQIPLSSPTLQQFFWPRKCMIHLN